MNENSLNKYNERIMSRTTAVSQMEMDAMDTCDIQAAVDPANRTRYTIDTVNKFERELTLRARMVREGCLSYITRPDC